jgi:DNA-binding transcriptional LysR family regulator
MLTWTIFLDNYNISHRPLPNRQSSSVFSRIHRGAEAMDQTALRYFLEVARSGSLSKASERLFVAVSALSRQIAKLEEQMGTPLFERRPRGMVLTEAGRLVANHARRSQLEEERVIDEIRGLSAHGRVMLRIAASQGVAPDFLPQVCRHFLKTWPGAHFQMDVSAPSVATQRVREGTHDVAVCFSMAPEKDVHVHYAQRAPIYAVMRSGHPLASREAVALADLVSWPVAMNNESGTLRQLFDIACSLEGLIFEPVFVANLQTALQSFVLNTDAITLAGYLTARSRLGPGGLTALPITNPELHQRTLQIQTMAGRTLPRAVVAFVDLVKEAIETPELVD